jgi:alkylation response protein AidB-like acyl-CoA dehydrogenase
MADVELTDDDARFRRDVAAWLADHVVGEYAELKGRGGPGDEDVGFDVRVAWEHELGKAGLIGLGWPVEFGGRGATLGQQVIWAEEYTRAQAPARVNHMGENLLAPTLIAYGTPEQQERFLPGILRGDERWCQGYSEPNAGSDLANVATRARLDGDEWVVDGQKVWTSLAHVSHWCFVVARTDPGSSRHQGLSFLLVPMDQPGVEVRPIEQITGGGEFNEVFFDGARTAAANVVGEVNGGWKVAMGTLAFERGASTLGQQQGFENELRAVIDTARANGRASDPVTRQRLARAWIGLRIMRWNALRSLTSLERGEITRETAISKLYWASYHRALGELTMDVLGPAAEVVDAPPYELSAAQRLFLWTRADTIYGGSNQIQRNVIGEQTLGLPREPRVDQ